jgi:hypothetical protein
MANYHELYYVLLRIANYAELILVCHVTQAGGPFYQSKEGKMGWKGEEWHQGMVKHPACKLNRR